MKGTALLRAAFAIALLVSAGGIGVAAQNSANGDFHGVKEFAGQINAYTPQNASGGPYEVRGPWSLKLSEDGRKADFYAAVNMELSDGWVLTLNSGNFNPSDRNAHTHHITMSTTQITLLPNGGLQISGTATITLNGGPAPVSPSPLTIAITGGTEVGFSNITLTFGSPGSNHFGTTPVTGVVHSVRSR